MRRIKFKPPLRQTMLGHAAYLASMAPGGKLPADLAASLASTLPAAPKKRAARVDGVDIDRVHGAKRTIPDPTEREIQSAILDLLRHHPKVAWAHRFNRGMVRSEYQGRESFTQFNTCKGFSDIHFLLKGGRAGYCEVKRPGGRATPEQIEFLDSCTKAGALAFIASSVVHAQFALSSA